MRKVSYERDFFGRTREQAALLRSGHLSELDVEHRIEEIESMGRSEPRQLTRRLEPLLMHLRKWEDPSDHREADGTSSRRTSREPRRRIPRLLRDTASLRPLIDACIRDAHEDARFGASDETGLSLSVFPEVCPYAPEQSLDQSFPPCPRSTGSAPAE